MASAGSSPNSVLAELDRILASPHFVRSPTLSRLLRFVVEAALEGKSGELKEYRLGVDVFDRGTDFDPRVDPIVRTQAAKLRARLAEYYDSDGQGDPVVISIPKGAYAPAFVASAEPAAASPQREAESPVRESIAVLPFMNMSADPENEYFSDGLTEELINILTTVPGLRVVARTSAFCFKNVAKDVREIGAQLNVRTVLEGSVRKAGNQLRVTAQLIDVSTGYHLLSRTYPRELKDVFAVQEELANAVVTEIMPQVRGQNPGLVLHAHAGNLDAYNVYLKGMFTLSRSFTGPQESIDIFRRTLEIDPAYAPASAGLAYAHFVLAWYSVLPAREAMPLARKAAEEALRADGSLALGHAILGAVESVFDWKWIQAEQSYRRAMTLQPGLALTYQLYAGTCLMAQRRMAEAVSAIENAIELNPFDAITRATATHIYGVAGNYQAAVQNFSLGMEVNPKAPLLYRAMALVHEAFGHHDKAIAAFRMASDISPRTPVSLARFGLSLVKTGNRAAAEQLLPELSPPGGGSALALAILHAGLGNTSESLRWLEEAIENREPYLMLVPTDPCFVPLHRDSRFAALLARMGLTGPTH